MCRPWSPGRPRRRAACADSKMSFETGDRARCRVLERPAEAEELLPDPDRDPVEHDRRDHLVGADGRLEEAGDPGPDRAGERRRARSRAAMCRPGWHAREATTPTQTATSAPTKYWPWPPMLNRPQRKANATARPVRISGVVRSSVCWRLSAASDPRSLGPSTQGKNQFRPVPSKIALYAVTGCGRSTSDDQAADQEGEERRQRAA